MHRRNNLSLGRFILLLVIFSSAFGGFGIVAGISILLTLVTYAIPVLFIIGLIVFLLNKSKSNKSKVKNINVTDFMNTLTNVDGNKINIDKDTYLLLTNKNELNLDNIEIYMRDEYVGTLAEYQNCFPNSFNTLCSDLQKTIGKKKNNKKEKETIIEKVEEKIVDKDCVYFINKFNELLPQMDDEQAKKSINETIDYLKRIQVIENEFGESKDKTRKLYEYYLPIYVDILANYDRLYDYDRNSDEFKQNEEKLKKTSTLINNALKTLCTSLLETYNTDLRVDMKTLESLLKKDGLVDDEINKEANNG